MDDTDLNALKDVIVPEASDGAKWRALRASQLAFEKAGNNSTLRSQGMYGARRLLSTFLQTTWEWTMERRIVVGALAASVLLIPVANHLISTPDNQFSPGIFRKRLDLPSSTGQHALAERDSVASGSSFGRKPAITSDKRAAEVRKQELKITRLPPVGTKVVRATPSPTLKRLREAPKASVQKNFSRGLSVGVPIMELKSNSDGALRSLPAPYVEQGRDNFESFKPNPVKVVSEDPVSTFSIDVDTASYAFIRRSIESGVLPSKNAVRVEEMINYFSYDYSRPNGVDAPFQPTMTVYPTPWNAETKLLHIGIKGYELIAEAKPRSNLVFLIDVSGSMQSQDKLPLLKDAFRLLVDRLEDEDSVAIVTYAGQAGTVLEPTLVKEKYKILNALDQLRSGGSTAGAQGIRQAYMLAESSFQKAGINRVILATDGDFNVGITDRKELKQYIEAKRESGVFLSILGFGRGNYNDALMQTLAQNGNGTAAYIDSLREAQKVMVEEANSTLFPIAKDVKIQIEFNPALVAEYRLIGYETRALRREDFNNDKVDAGDVGSGHTVTAIYEISPADSAKKKIDDLRYQARTEPAATGNMNEFAFLKLRYKLPKQTKSKLITLPITKEHEVSNVDALKADLRFAASVAAFGQKLRNDSYLGDYDFDDILRLATKARGDDPYGYRSEFVSLVRLAKALRKSDAQ